MKHPIILDACNIINLLRIDEDDEFLFKAITSMELRIVKFVYDEARRRVKANALSPSQSGYIDQHLPSLQSYMKDEKEVINDLPSETLSRIKEFVEHKGKDNGELFSCVLALYVSRTEETRAFFFTDDFKAKQKYTPYFSFQQIGPIGDSVDLLHFLYWIRSDFDHRRLESYLQSLYSEYCIPLKMLVEELSRKKGSLAKGSKGREISHNIDNIIDGFYSLDSNRLNAGMTYFHDSKIVLVR